MPTVVSLNINGSYNGDGSLNGSGQGNPAGFGDQSWVWSDTDLVLGGRRKLWWAFTSLFPILRWEEVAAHTVLGNGGVAVSRELEKWPAFTAWSWAAGKEEYTRGHWSHGQRRMGMHQIRWSWSVWRKVLTRKSPVQALDICCSTIKVPQSILCFTADGRPIVHNKHHAKRVIVLLTYLQYLSEKIKTCRSHQWELFMLNWFYRYLKTITVWISVLSMCLTNSLFAENSTSTKTDKPQAGLPPPATTGKWRGKWRLFHWRGDVPRKLHQERWRIEPTRPNLILTAKVVIAEISLAF